MIKRGDYSVFWDAPYRPLFLFGFLCALLSVVWWPLGVQLGLPEPGLQPAVLWHVHELLFGFASAAIAGYLLTALPGWTGRPPLRGPGLKVLVSLWLLARAATAISAAAPLDAILFVNAAFFLGLAGYLLHELTAARAFCKLGFACAVLALGLSEAAYLSNAAAGNVWSSLDLAQSVLTGLVLLLFSVASRAIPAFTCNWLALSGRTTVRVRERPLIRAVSQGLLALVLALQLAGAAEAANAVLIAAAIAMFWSSLGWRTAVALCNPLLAALHLAWLWLPFGAMAAGATGLGLFDYPSSAALHSITIGAMSGLIVAITGRASAHSSDGIMRAGKGFTTGAILIWLTVWIRLAVPLSPTFADGLIAAAGMLWCVGWIAFTLGFLPSLIGPVRRPALSGRSFRQP
ncbi:NnrS family protein [Leisingera caerulea]|uniref:NnrS family protein n=1 Tax=Leisingera caerulea TaxID=506591 RepID=UPI0004844437|nr:NnrS family protein [Leisingera caerulea]